MANLQALTSLVGIPPQAILSSDKADVLSKVGQRMKGTKGVR